jgi:Chemoreceptor zinc-binding domain
MTLDAIIELLDKKAIESESYIASTEAKVETLSSTNLKQILDTHHVLKKKLQAELNGAGNGSLDVVTISHDNACAIGKWLYGEGKALYGHLPEYESARKVHAELHLCAGEVLSEHYVGNLDQAQILFKTKFRTSSSKNQIEFARLFSAAKV